LALDVIHEDESVPPPLSANMVLAKMAALSSISTLFGLPQDATQRSQPPRFNFTRRKADAMKFALLLVLLFVSTDLSAQSGWRTVKDKTGSCQISVPPTWTLLGQPGLVSSPQHITTMVISGNTRFSPFSAGTFKVLNVDKVFENSTTRIFYVGKPGGNPPLVSYHVEAPGKVNTCIAEIGLLPNTLEDDAKKIALSLSKTP
jgi:hypothetical protein